MDAPLFFPTSADFRVWLEKHHAATTEAWVGFHKRGSGRASLTWPESVDQALCFGWIDGLRKSIDAARYKIRFTPRRPASAWSAVNLKRVAALKKLGLMRPAGLEAFARRVEEKARSYSYEQRKDAATLEPAQEKRLRADKKAWAFFSRQAPWYRRTAVWWVITAKKQETRDSRLARLIADSAAGRTIPPLTRPHGRQARDLA